MSKRSLYLSVAFTMVILSLSSCTFLQRAEPTESDHG
jgi:hypothetical protein